MDEEKVGAVWMEMGKAAQLSQTTEKDRGVAGIGDGFFTYHDVHNTVRRGTQTWLSGWRTFFFFFFPDSSLGDCILSLSFLFSLLHMWLRLASLLRKCGFGFFTLLVCI